MLTQSTVTLSNVLSQVSRAWRGLAEDGVLWFKMCIGEGYHQDASVSDSPCWKSTLRDFRNAAKTMCSNWKVGLGCAPVVNTFFFFFFLPPKFNTYAGVSLLTCRVHHELYVSIWQYNKRHSEWDFNIIADIDGKCRLVLFWKNICNKYFEKWHWKHKQICALLAGWNIPFVLWMEQCVQPINLFCLEPSGIHQSAAVWAGESAVWRQLLW